jgi:hypothetical protein
MPAYQICFSSWCSDVCTSVLICGAGSSLVAAAPQPIPSWVLVLTDSHVFLFPMKRDKSDPAPVAYAYNQTGIDVGGREIEPHHVTITLPGQESRRFEVPELWRRQVAVIAAALDRGR